MTKRIEGIQACVFDAYGTLFDFNSAVARCHGELGEKAQALSNVWRDKQLQYTWLRSLMGRHRDFRQVTADALDFAMASVGIEHRGLRDKLLESYETLDAFPEVVSTLEALRSRGLKTAILSNGTPEMLRAAAEGTGMAPLLDAVLSVEDVGIYKPHPSVYQIAVNALRLEAESICFVSSNAWDAHGAAAFGLVVAWCNRYGQRPELLPGRVRVEIRSLDELPGLLG